MNLVRILLIIIGVALLAGIVWWERQRRTQPTRRRREVLDGIGLEIHTDGGEPLLDLSDLDGITATSDATPNTPTGSTRKAVTASATRTQPEEEKLVVLNLLAPADQPFLGLDILTAIQGANLAYGEMSIFHHHIKGRRRPIFSMANLVEPGTFDPPSMDDFVTPGLTLFMRLPGAMKGPQALDQMLKSAQHLATELGGTLCDQRRQPLEKKAITKLRADVAKHQQRIDEAASR